MVFRSRIHLRRRMLITLAVGTAIAACCLIYFVFLYLEGFPLGSRIAGKVMDDLLDGQFLSNLDLKVEVKPETSILQGEAKLTFFLPQRRMHALQRRLLFFLPSDVIFFLHPDLRIKKLAWGDRSLKVKRMQSSVFVDLEGPPPDDGVVILDVSYEGIVGGGGWRSFFMPDLVYLDPKDHYYPHQGHTPCSVQVTFQPPPGLTAVAPGLDEKKALDREGTPATFAFNGPVTSFMLVACPSAPAVRHIGTMDYHFYGWGDRVEALAETLVDIQDFYATRLPPPAIRELRIVSRPGRHVPECRYDETGTILFPSDVTEEDLAFITARYWIKPVEEKQDRLFSHEEIARGLALYFIQECRGDPLFKKKLLDISRTVALAGPVLEKSRRTRSVVGGGKDWTGPGAYLVSILRRSVGNQVFDRILRAMLRGAAEGEDEGWERWHEVTMQMSRENLSWLFRRWAGQERILDLAIVDFRVEPRPIGQRVMLGIKNQGDLDLPEKVKLLLITDKGVFFREMRVPRSREDFTDSYPERVIGVVLDPDMEWFDVDRRNNIAYLAPPPYLLMPSEDNQYLAVAYHKRADADTYPLVVFRTDGRSRRAFNLDHPVGALQWIGEHRLLVHVGQGTGNSPAGAVGPTFLIDTLAGKAERIGPGVEVFASDSGRFLLINEKQGDGWRHRLKDIDRRLTRPFLNKLPFRFKWIPGTDLILPDYPSDYGGNVAIYSPGGAIVYPFSGSDSRLFNFRGFEGGLAFMREREGSKYFYTIAGPDQRPRQLARLSGEPMTFHVSKYGGIFHLKEMLPDKRIRLRSIDPTDEKTQILYEGSADELYDTFCQKGLLFKKTYRDPGGTLYHDILFHRFGEEEGRLITHSPAPERVLALVSNERYLYYAQEIQAPWSNLSTYNTYRFFRYDFLNRENEELQLNAWWP